MGYTGVFVMETLHLESFKFLQTKLEGQLNEIKQTRNTKNLSPDFGLNIATKWCFNDF